MPRKKSLPAFLADPPKPSLFGGFTMTPFISTHVEESKTDPYINLEPIPSRYLGKNFTTTVGKKGHGRDVYFDHTFSTMASPEQNGDKGADPYITREQLDRQANIKAKEKNIDKNADFKYVSFPKRSTGPGSYFGTLSNKPFEHMKDYDVPTKDDVPRKPAPEKPNFLVNPPKKGTFGVPGTTFGPKLEHKADGYEEVRAREKDQWETEKKKRVTEDVWKISLKSKYTFDEKATGVSSAFDSYEVPEDTKSKKKRQPKAKVWPGKPLVHPSTFKYSSPSKSGVNGYLNKFANVRDEGMEDPYNAGPRPPPEGANKKKKTRGKKEAKPLVHDSHWKPCQGPKSSVVRSLLRRFF